MGEHAVVYDYPAIGLPVPAVAIRVRQQSDPTPGRLFVLPPLQGTFWQMRHKNPQNVQAAINLAQEHCSLKIKLQPSMVFDWIVTFLRKRHGLFSRCGGCPSPGLGRLLWASLTQ